ncbi:MAG TPA: hypothetical protein VMJ10_05160 [Kofleriaceae bacterium]|nr:hypothetical protein [Kofleriaceae bacterium]
MRGALVLVVLLVARAALADPVEEWAKGVPEDQQHAANKLFAEGNQLFAQQAHAPALEKYRAAIALWDHPMIRFNMAVTLIRLDRILEAADNLDRALRYGAAPFPTELYQQALDYQALIRGRLGVVDASCEQAGAHVLFDGKPWFDCPGKQSQRVMAGEHALVASLDGFITTTRRLVVVGGGTKTEQLRLVPIDTAVKLEYPYPRWIPWTTAGGGAAIALAGLGVWLWGRSQMDHFQSDFAQQCPTGCDASLPGMPALADERTAAHLKGEIGATLMIGGGAIAAAGVVGAYLDKPKRILPNIEVAPTSGGGIARARWRF